MTPALQGWRDVAGLVGVFLFCGFLVACLPWPRYPRGRDRDFVDRATRRKMERAVWGDRW